MTEPLQTDSQFAFSPGGLLVMFATLAVGVYFFTALPASTPEPETPVVTPANSFADIDLEAKAAIVVDLENGKTLYEKNTEVQLPLASLTKVMLVLVAAEALSPETSITIPHSARGANGEELPPGERWKVQDIIDFTLVSSSNSGAEILAAAANGTIHQRHPASPEDAATLWRMNDLAQTLGLAQTYFLNVSGLDLSETQAGAYGSARDMASLFAYVTSAEASLFSGTASNGVLLTSENGRMTSAQNTNTAQGAIAGLILGKTGLTDLAGGNLAVVFDVGLAHPVVAIVLGSSGEGRFKDIEKLVSTTQKALKDSTTYQDVSQ